MSGPNHFIHAAYGLCLSTLADGSEHAHDCPMRVVSSAECLCSRSRLLSLAGEVVAAWRELEDGRLPEEYFDIRQMPPEVSPRLIEALEAVGILKELIGSINSQTEYSQVADNAQALLDLLYGEDVRDALEDSYPSLSVPSQAHLLIMGEKEDEDGDDAGYVVVGWGLPDSMRHLLDIGHVINTSFRDKAELHQWVEFIK